MLQPTDTTAIPAMTHLVAHAAFPNGSLAIRLRDAFGPIFSDAAFTELYPALGQPAESPARLALVTILQFVENLPDRQAADAVRARIDWKYALGLDLSDPGFHYSVLSEFRQRLVTHEKARLLLDILLDHCATNGLLDGKRKQRTDSTHVLAAVRALSLLELVGETMRRALSAIAQVAPAWLQLHLAPEWIKRYGRRFDSYHFPKGEAERTALAEQIGRDGVVLLKAVWADETPPEVRTLPIVDVLRRIWVQQFYLEAETVHWRTKKQWGQPPATLMIASPEDVEASYCVKRSTEWTGYKVHFTETCATDHPRLITDVETTPATTHDVKMTAAIQDNLAARELLPEVQLVDEGYMDTDLLVTSQQKGVDLVGPIPSHKSWQSRTEDAFDHTQFVIDWDAKQARCPGGRTSTYYAERTTTRGTPNVLFAFRVEDCRACPLRERCTRAGNVGRTLTVYPQVQYEAQERARQRQTTEESKLLYSERAGIEGTISQGVRGMDVRHARYIGLARTHLQHVATAAAINVVRIVDWLMGDQPEPTPRSPLLAFAA
jgi:transposase